MIDFDSKYSGSSTLHYTIWKNSKQNLRLAELLHFSMNWRCYMITT